MDLGADDYLTKPIWEEDLISAIGGGEVDGEKWTIEAYLAKEGLLIYKPQKSHNATLKRS